MFLPALIRARRFFPFKLSFFLFFFFNYHSDLYDTLKSLYVHQMITNHLIKHLNHLNNSNKFS